VASRFRGSSALLLAGWLIGCESPGESGGVDVSDAASALPDSAPGPADRGAPGGSDGGSGSSVSSDGGVVGEIAAPPASPPVHDPNKPPGQNFALPTWKLSTGTGAACEPGLRPAAIAAGATAPHFFTDKTDGAMTLVAGGGDCVTSNTSHPRTEFRELWKGDPDPSGGKDTSQGWTISGTHILDVWMSVTGTNTVVGQIHPISGGSNYPLLKCYFTGSGLSCSMEKSLSKGGDSSGPSFSGLSSGKPFFFRLSYAAKKICVSVGATPSLALAATKCATPSDSFLSPTLLNYFKVGNYQQGSGTATVKIHYLATYHGP
jgi:hypothetical protein